MKVRHQFRMVAALAVTLVGGVPATAASQLVRGVNTSAPTLVVVTFKSADKRTGVDFAETVRDRITGDVSYRELQVQTKQNIDATLQASGYDMTAALTEGDANLLAKQLRADEYIEGTINKNAAGNGYTSEAWMVLTLDPNFVQPLGTFDAAKLGDVAAQISKAYQAAHKAYDDVVKCRNARRENKFAEAMSAASSGIAKYPKSTMLRICQMATLADEKKAPAEVLKVAQEILQIDPKSKSALQAEVDAYDQLGELAKTAHDTVKAAEYNDKKIATLASLLAADPTNTKLQQNVVYELAQSGKYDVALKIIRKAVEDNPGDIAFNKLYWQLLYAVKDYKTMVAVGEEMVKIDTSFADTTYFDRTIEALRSDSAWARAAETAARATQKYPRRADYWVARGQNELKAGQVKQAITSLKHALDIDPKTAGARLLIVSSLVDANEYDSAMVSMHEAMKAGENADRIGQLALVIASRLFTAANAANPKTIPSWQKVLPYAAFADSASGDRTTKNTAKFEMGVSHYYLATLTYPDVVTQKSCDGAKQVQDYLIAGSGELQAGGAANPAAVNQLMPAIQQLQTQVETAVKVFCAPSKKPDAGGRKP